jgi:2-polyprenyl-6-methoxyphenol hydroxylase-like FAD-dependent oxidoreductase
MAARADVVVVGAGIAGSALATGMAREGYRVVLLERQTSYRDKVRGAVLACSGVVEALRLELEKPLLEAGGSYATRAVPYDEVTDPALAQARVLPLDALLPGVPGALDVGHPEACEALTQAAAAAGATVVRGIGEVEVVAGTAPVVRYEHDGVVHDVPCRLVVGADGRMSTVRRRLGIPLQQTVPRTMGGGMLVDGLHTWPSTQISIGTEDDLFHLIFPRAAGRARLYLLHDVAQKRRFAGPDRQAEFLAAYRFRCIPDSAMLNDSWTAEPYVPDVVLVGDAAGRNDPIIGQGLSIALRDARVVTDLLRDAPDWTPAALAPYGAQRRERMPRLRIAAQVSTERNATFTPAGAARRNAVNEVFRADPLLAGPRLAPQVGPENVPAEAFEQATLDRILALA